ncbi:hypothetical protein [Microcoleus sp. ARI1-B5]|uniref:hypothetical protein n=2 Tax=Microcoleus TaxID=44471 RepID=UPI002FD6E324
MFTPSDRVRLMKEMRKSPSGDLLAKWEASSQWLSRFEDSDDWSIALMDGDRTPCVTIGFVLE